MRAVKGNREYTISEQSKNGYVNDGYDIYEGDEKIATGKGKTVSYEEHEETMQELEKLKKEYEETMQELTELKTKSKPSKKTEDKEGE